jgi:hypothetical protein
VLVTPTALPPWDAVAQIRHERVITTTKLYPQTSADYSALGDINLRSIVVQWDRELNSLSPIRHGGILTEEPALCELSEWGRQRLDVAGVASQIGESPPGLVESESATADSEPQTAFEAIQQIAWWCDLPIKHVVSATGVKHRTYYAWNKEKVQRPRLDSQGSLWLAYETIRDLHDALGDGLPRWLRIDKARLSAFHRGHFDDLTTSLAIDQLGDSPRTGSAVWTRTGAVGDELQLPRLGPHRPVESDGANLRGPN